MLHRVMIKTTPLHDVAGRVDYISNPDRQEQLVYADEACADLGFWKDLSAYCQKSAPGKRAREGRELIIPLPNEFSKEIPPEDIANAFRSLLEQETGTRWAIALHWNKTKQSYHLHAVGSENPEVRENDVTPESVKPRKPLKRDTYFDADGKRSVKQKCIDPETKELLPGCFLVKKGEVQPARAPERFGQKVRRMTQKSFLKEVKADVADLMTEMCRYADIDKEFVLADFIREDTLYLKQVSRKKGLPEEKSKKADAYNKTAQEYNEAVDALMQHYPEAAHTDELEQIAQLMNRKSAADRDGFVGAVREITKALQMQFAAARAAAARPKVSSVADFASRYREKSSLDAADHNLNRVLRYFRAAIEDDDKGAARRYYEMTAKRERDDREEER